MFRRTIVLFPWICLSILNYSHVMSDENVTTGIAIFDDDITDLDGDYCEQKFSCKQPDILDRNCKCDSECILYNDCCYDFESNKTSSKTFIPNISCEYVQEIDSDSFVYMVKTCPPGTSSELKKACENLANGTFAIPVSGLNTGFLYRNMFCAACNKEDYLFWKAGFSCNWTLSVEVNKTIESIRNDENCDKILNPPTPTVKEGHKTQYDARQCFPVINTCVSGKQESACTNGHRKLVFDHDVYKNIDCALCNNLNTENFTCSSRSWRSRPKLKRKRTNYSYRLLFDFSTSETIGTYRKRFRLQPLESERKVCPPMEVYDLFTGGCRRVNCISPLIYENSKCTYSNAEATDKANRSTGGNDRRDCVYVRLNDTEYEIINQTNIFIHSLNKTVTNYSFYQSGDDTFVCQDVFLDTSENNVPFGRFYSESESILSLVGSVLSITALSITLVLYLRFPKLQNTPGKSLICLMVSLFVAQLLFLLAMKVEDHHHVCIGFAVMIHYAFLASVFWMNCMSFDIFFTFSKGFVKSDGSKSIKTFLWYSLYAWIMPFLIVLSGICLDAVTLNEYRPKYGEIVCWIGNKQAILVYFLVPIGLIVTANIFFYVFTVRSIFISNRQSNKILRRKKTCKVFVYVKLSIVMGLTWIFAYVASFTNETVFWYLFIFFNSWQGVFIFISFVCFGKVRTYIAERASVVSSYFQSRTVSYTLTSSSSRH